MAKVLALILAGGRVDELREITIYRPKSAVPFGAVYRIIDFPLSNLMHSGIGHVGVLSQYRSAPLINHVADGRSWDLWGRNRELKLLPPFKGAKESDWYNGTVDAVAQNVDFIRAVNPDWILIISGDHVYKMDYRDLLRFHVEKNAQVTVAFTPIPPNQSSRFGVAEIAENDERGGEVLEYREKPATGEYRWASMTIYVFQPQFLFHCLDNLRSALQNQQTVEFGRDLLTALARDSGTRVFGYTFRGFWGYTRTLEEYWQAHMKLLDPESELDLERWQVRTNLAHRGIRDRVPATVAPTAEVQNSLISHGCRIYGCVENSVLSPGVVVEKGAVVRNSVVMFDTLIRENARVDTAILDADVTVESGVIVAGNRMTEKGSPRLVVVGEGETVHQNIEAPNE